MVLFWAAITPQGKQNRTNKSIADIVTFSNFMYTYFNQSDSKENQKAGSWLTEEDLGMEECNQLLNTAKTADKTEGPYKWMLR